jgi:arylsulfatase A-like enzyme
VDRLGDAIYDAPELNRVDTQLAGYWRKMRSPYVGPAGSLGRAVKLIALVRKQGTPGKQVGAGKGWNPDPRTWNMAEGSFDQREAVLAPPPCTIRAKLTVPTGAVFETAPVVLATGGGSVLFELAVRRANGTRVVVKSVVVEPGGGIDPAARRSWSDLRVDLGAFAGQQVELELVTRTMQAGATAAAFWGTPVVLSPGASPAPFNVLFVVIDSMRGDAVASTHSPELDLQMAKAAVPPLDAWLPSIPEVAPHTDALAKRGVVLEQAWSAANWTRPGTIAMLAGTRSQTLGLGSLELLPPVGEVRAFYAAKPAFLPLVLRPYGVLSRAFVNNFYLVGYAGAGVDMGFEGVVDHRYQVSDTEKITRDTVLWLEAHKDQRFALFVNYNSPHGPYEPPRAALDAIPRPPRGPRDPLVRAFLGEIHKDDAAVGELVAALERLGLRDDTLVLVTGDHGETLSAEHDGVALKVDKEPPPGRFQHLRTIWDETLRIPVVMSWPKGLPENRRVSLPVDTTVILPTLLELAGIAPWPSITGYSILPSIRGEHQPERPVIMEGRGTRAIRSGAWRLIMRDPIARAVRTPKGVRNMDQELYQVDRDPGERQEVSHEHPDVVADLRRQLEQATRRLDPRGSDASRLQPATVRLRFAGAGQVHQVSGILTTTARLGLKAIGLREQAVRQVPGGYTFEFATEPGRVVGVDLKVDPAQADLTWQLELDHHPWPAEAVFAGSFGLLAPELVQGLVGESARLQAAAELEPLLSAREELGVFVTRTSAARELDLGVSSAASQETMRLMQAWGYARADEQQP